MFTALLKSIFLLIILSDLSIVETDIIKDPSITGLLPISSFNSANVYFIYLGTQLFGTVLFVTSSDQSNPHWFLSTFLPERIREIRSTSNRHLKSN